MLRRHLPEADRRPRRFASGRPAFDFERRSPCGISGGGASLNAVATAPGVAWARASNSSKNAAWCSLLWYLVRLRYADSVTTRSASKPSGTLTTFHSVRSSSAEPPSRPNVNAICTVTSANRTRGFAPGDDEPVVRRLRIPPARKTEIAGQRLIVTPCDHREQDGDNEHAHVDGRRRDALGHGAGSRGHRGERVEEREGQQQPDRARCEGEQQTLGNRQARESQGAGTKGGANRELPLALGHARQHEIGDVDARDQQKDRDGADEQPGDARGIADPPVAQRPDAQGMTPRGQRRKVP